MEHADVITIVAEIITVLISILLGVVAFNIRRLTGKIDKLTDTVADASVRLTVMEDRWERRHDDGR